MTKPKVSIRKIDWLSTEDLINELFNRCDAALFIGKRPEENAPHNYWWHARGDCVTTRGLIETLYDRILEDDDVSETED